MNLLLLRLSSLGDVLHTLPAISDLAIHRPDLQVDWLVESAFAPIVAWHPAVHKAIPFSLRGLKKKPLAAPHSLHHLRKELRASRYDMVLDAQGLYKSALLARLAGAPVMGLDTQSAREPGASRLYQRQFSVSWSSSAIARNRQFFALALQYALPSTSPDFALACRRSQWQEQALDDALQPFVCKPFVIGFHATSAAWKTKEWPEAHWKVIASRLAEQGWNLLLPAADERERQRVGRIQSGADNVLALPQLSLEFLAKVMSRAQAFVGMDTGLSYLATALGLNGVTLYGPTSADRFFIKSSQQISLQSPQSCAPCGKSRCPLPEAQNGRILCQEALEPERVWLALSSLLESSAA
ncbi:lipopolysaccharide heptosyltransferase I [Acidithiobacillus marinus]|uniref:Lipopolysaccharide heptosyltransferase 1 n=1 Tax=Acidithiobacillus marinus TaxID=187490 RepID=A0A2I1DQ10_9PROT|nr:lipopolysaccharide heptosyltransferase I [Acidithiobacillus marinus]PKY11946.1 lipopolysaccharide heptosyltransferase I [Acidithiobacillus marinus]